MKERNYIEHRKRNGRIRANEEERKREDSLNKKETLINILLF